MRINKLLVVVVVVAVLFTLRIYEIAGWLERYGLVHYGREFERTYLTGSSVAVIVFS